MKLFVNPCNVFLFFFWCECFIHRTCFCSVFFHSCTVFFHLPCTFLKVFLVHAFLCFFGNCTLFWCFAVASTALVDLRLLVPASRYHWGTKFRRVCVCSMCVLCVVCVMRLCFCVFSAWVCCAPGLAVGGLSCWLS